MWLNKLFFALIVLLCLSCNSNKTFQNEQELLQWINNPKNKLVKQSTVSGYTFRCKYLPSDYLAFNESKRLHITSQERYDSVRKSFQKSIAFLITLSIDTKDSGEDVMYKNVDDYESFNERVQKVNFGIDQFISMYADNTLYKPVLWRFEDVYKLTTQRTLYIVFAPKEKNDNFYNAKKYDIIFDDGIFNTGLSHFSFLKEHINTIPVLQFTLNKGQ